MNRRVVVTGMAGISPIGNDWPTAKVRLQRGENGVVRMASWADYEGLNTQLAAPAAPFATGERYTRKNTRTMGRVSLMGTVATEWALRDAGLLEDPLLTNGHMGVAYGSSVGTTSAVGDFGRMLEDKSTRSIHSTSYVKMMGHTAPVNVGLFFGVKGRIVPTSSACTSSSQGIGYAYEMIRNGKQVAMIAGGSEELCPTEAAVFDVMFATSLKNDTPHLTPRPFDTDRDGLVIGEGAGTLILEDLEHAQARGAKIHAEIVGFGTNSDGYHITHPNIDTMMIAMQLALEDAGLPASAIGYVNAHGTSTEHGDVAESHATSRVYGSHMPFSSFKSYTGHTLGACGALEAWLAISMQRENWFAATANLRHVDPACGALDYIMCEPRAIDCEYVVSNNFAFGGINTSLVFRRWA